MADNFSTIGYIQCPNCGRRNPPGAVLCRYCDTPLPVGPTEEVVVPSGPIPKGEWLQGYAVACWIIAILIGIATVIISVILALIPNERGPAVFLIVAGASLLAIHILMARGLWLEKRWAMRMALMLHGFVLGFGLLWVIVSVADVQIPYLRSVLTPTVLLVLIGSLAIWVGMRAEEGERMAVYGPDPESLADLLEAEADVYMPAQADQQKESMLDRIPKGMIGIAASVLMSGFKKHKSKRGSSKKAKELGGLSDWLD
jgi:hypothetical protein